MDRYFSKSVIFLSFLEGFSVFIIVIFFVEFKTALTISLLSASGMLIINPLCLFLYDRKYSDIELYIEENVLLKENIYFRFYGKVRNGYLFLTQDVIYLHSRDKKPYLEAFIYKTEIEGIEMINDVNMYIYINGNYIYELQSYNCRKIINELIKSGWIEMA